MTTQLLVKKWFEKWENGDYLHLPISPQFRHHSPFVTISGKDNYIDLIRQNEDKFLGYHFDIHEEIYDGNRACVRYTSRQGTDFHLDVSEWYRVQDDLIAEIFSYYHIGEIRKDRELS